MDPTFHNTAHRALFLPPLVQFNGAFNIHIVIKLSECRAWCSKPALHVFKKEQLHQPFGF